MRLLVLGGTVFLSYEVCRVAAERGHIATAVCRGISGAPPPGVTFAHGDRSDPDVFAGLRTSTWDAVVDISRQPGHVARAVRELHDCAGRYVFISSISAYDFNGAGQGKPTGSTIEHFRHEDDTPLLTALLAAKMDGVEEYGPAKVACEDHVRGTFGPERSVILRPGIIGGPGDTSGRSAYWPARFAAAEVRQEPVLIPAELDQPVQLVDVRDVAEFVVTLTEAHNTPDGPVDVVGPPTTLGKAIDAADEAAHAHRAAEGGGATDPSAHNGADTNRTRIPATAAWLADHNVSPWAGPRSLPLWLGTDLPAYPMMLRQGSRAVELGLRRRDLQKTLADELATLAADYLSGAPPSGLTDGEHRELLTVLRDDGHPPAGREPG